MESKNKLKCHTARHKLKESEYWLECLKKSEIYHDDKIADFYLNALLSTTCSIPDYVRSDFIHVTVNPRLEWKKWKYKKKRKKEIENHPQKNALQNFEKFNDKKYEEFRNIPLINHWFYRRNITTHRRWDVFKASSTSEDHDGTITYFSRSLEGSLIPDIRICDDRISEQENEELVRQLNRMDAVEVIQEILKHFEMFIMEFENEDYFKNP